LTTEGSRAGNQEPGILRDAVIAKTSICLNKLFEGRCLSLNKISAMAYPKFVSIPLSSYLAIEVEDGERYEYLEGYLYKMSGGTVRHEAIIDNVNGSIREELRKKQSGCKTYPQGLKIELREGLHYVYADGSVFCEPLEESTHISGAARNPVIVIEVLSKSTFGYDRGEKGEKYRAMPSLREYVLITQTRPSVSLYSRKDRFTLFTYQDLLSLEDTLHLESIGVSVPLRLIYENIEFEEEDKDPTTSRKLYEPVMKYGKPTEPHLDH
jgi:Uma2 family endonuclease